MNLSHVLVKSYGCSANQADGEVLAGCLRQAGFQLAENIQSADVVIYNCCAVKGPTEDRMISAVRRAPREKKVIIAGCLPMINPERLKRETRFNGLVGPAFGSDVVEIVKRVCTGEKVIALENALTAKPDLCLPRERSNPVVSVVPVNYGCLGACAYCCVLFARGRLRSYSISEIIDRFKADLSTGTQEFWLTSQDIACYGRDLKTNLADLLKAVCKLPGYFRVRIGMMTPNNVIDLLDELLEAYQNDKVFKFIHLPLQSGDNEILKQMRRFYSVEQFKEIVDSFRATLPRIILETDVICGFPGESRNAFEHTAHFLSEIKPDVVNVSKFFARPGTAAAKISQGIVETTEIKKRSTEMTRVAKRISFDQNQRWVGWIGEILVDEKGKVPGSWVGRNFAYKPTVVKSASNLLGKTLVVRIVEAFQTHLLGEIVA